MLPQDVYEHMKYTTGAKPGASLTTDQGEYIVSREGVYKSGFCTLDFSHYKIVATFYPTTGTAKPAPLGEIPTTDAALWKQYYTHEG